MFPEGRTRVGKERQMESLILGPHTSTFQIMIELLTQKVSEGTSILILIISLNQNNLW